MVEERRYYPKGTKHKKTFSNEFIAKMEEDGIQTKRFDTASKEIILTRKEQEEAYARCLNMVLDETRWVLDNLENLPEFKINSQDYSKRVWVKKPVGKKNPL